MAVGIRLQTTSWLTAKLTANPCDNRGSRRMALDSYSRPELRRCDRRRPAEQLTSPRVEVPNGASTAHSPLAIASSQREGGTGEGLPALRHEAWSRDGSVKT
jgi:hypothetical protein